MIGSRRRSRAVTLGIAGLLVAVLTGAGCGSSGSDAFPVGTLDPQRLATAGLLTIDAFPPPWRSVPNRADPAGFDRCAEIAAALGRGRQVRSTSPEFAEADQEQAEQSVAVYDSPAGAALVMRTVRLPAFQQCLQTLLTRAARQNAATPAGAPAPAVSTSVSRLRAPARGSDRVSYQVTVSITTATRARTVQYVDVDMMRVDRVVVALLTQRRFAPPLVDRDRLLRILAIRINTMRGAAATATGN